MADFGNNPYGFKDAVTIEAERIFDSCSDRDCLEDLEVVFPDYESTQLVNEATFAKARCVEVTSVYFQVEPIPFNCGFYSVDLTYTFGITLELNNGTTNPSTVTGTACFTKKVILYGSDGGTKYFTSSLNGERNVTGCNGTSSANPPKASVSIADPIVLNLKLCAIPAYSACADPTCTDSVTIPARRAVCITIGLFSIVSLSRTVPVMVPAFNYEVPCKECSSGNSCTTETPCELFEKIRFPSNEFFPKSLEEATAGSASCSTIANAVSGSNTCARKSCQ